LPRLLLFAVLVALAAGGCGSGSGETTTPTPTPTPTQAGPAETDVVALADTICRNHQSRREDLESQATDLGPITSREQAHRIAALLRKESQNRRAEAGELEGLQGSWASLARVVAAIRAEASVIEDWAKAYDRLDSADIQRLQIRLGAITVKAAKAARADGFEVCGQQ
jgi:hypothetical protein